ncbi:MAG: 50S ribosomal protein L23 [Deltaproteobacteria bacterium]|jgi:large subunit ribosomal protein L23|nr:50S ribosomal protein L23 [Deltaproteobacteria bacterium]
MKPFHEVLIRPIHTENINTRREKYNQYMFQVSKDANKIDIAHAIETAFNVKNKVLSVNTINVRGKFKRLGRKGGYRPSWKKAVVRLAKGVTLENVYTEN